MEWKMNTKVAAKLNYNRGWQESTVYTTIMKNDYNLNHWLLQNITSTIISAIESVKPYQLFKHYRILVNLNDCTYKISLTKNKRGYLICEWDLYNEPAIYSLRPNSFSITNSSLPKNKQLILSRFHSNFNDNQIINYNEKDYSLRISVDI